MFFLKVICKSNTRGLYTTFMLPVSYIDISLLYTCMCFLYLSACWFFFQALIQLHQLDVLGCKLVVEFARSDQSKNFPSQLEKRRYYFLYKWCRQEKILQIDIKSNFYINNGITSQSSLFNGDFFYHRKKLVDGSNFPQEIIEEKADEYLSTEDTFKTWRWSQDNKIKNFNYM